MARADSPCGTATPLPRQTCSSYICAVHLILRPQPGRLECDVGGCTAKTCCLAPTTTVMTTLTTTPVPTFTTTPMPTCAGFSCPSGKKIKPFGKNIPCIGSTCTAATCCDPIITTVTTTPVPTCSGFFCFPPLTLRLQPERLACDANGCRAQTCCLEPTTTMTTTPVLTCGGFSCPTGTSIKPLADSMICSGSKCTASACCKRISTTVTTTQVPTCSGFTCLSPMNLRPFPGRFICTGGRCTVETCCLEPITTATTTPAPLTCASYTCDSGSSLLYPAVACVNACDQKQCCKTLAPSNPCGTVTPAPARHKLASNAAQLARKYSAEAQPVSELHMVERKTPTSIAAWMLPFFGVLSLFSCFALVASLRIRSKRSTRQIHALEPASRLELTSLLPA